MKEIEVKIRNIDKEDIISKIEKRGAQRVFAGKVIDIRYDTPERTLSKQGKAMRIRQKGRLFYLNFKGKKKSIQNITGRDEIGVRIGNLKVMQKILNELGYNKIFELVKYRTEYRLGDVVFDIDEYVGMDPILEIECESYAKVQEEVDKLKIKKEDIGRVYIREVLAARKKFDEQKAKEKTKK